MNFGQETPKLTSGQIEVLQLMTSGLRRKEIAFKLDVTEGAIQARLAGAKRKLGASNTAQAVKLALHFGLIS